MKKFRQKKNYWTNSLGLELHVVKLENEGKIGFHTANV